VTFSADLDLIIDAAREAGALALRLRSAGLEVAYKPGNSPLTNADLAADAQLKERLRSARPDYGWLSEETADNTERLTRDRIFVVDPIDGTRAFVKGRPWWSVCIAVVEADRPVAAVVFAPDLDEIYTAQSRGGAYLNGKPIEASQTAQVEGCSMVGDEVMFQHPSWPTPWPNMRIEPRNSTAYRMCLVASGAFDATIAMGPKSDWDIAAAELIATESKAHCSDHKGRPFVYNRPNPQQRSMVCAAPRLAPLILERVSPIG